MRTWVGVLLVSLGMAIAGLGDRLIPATRGMPADIYPGEYDEYPDLWETIDMEDIEK